MEKQKNDLEKIALVNNNKQQNINKKRKDELFVIIWIYL